MSKYSSKIATHLTLLIAQQKKKNRVYRKTLEWRLRRATAPARMLPNFIIIGAQKCGTTSLYQYLSEHPQVIPALKKEIHFFDDMEFGKGLNWYRAYFPLSIQKYYAKIFNGQRKITGEASPYYIFYPHSPKRISAVAPNVKFIIMLRNPVDRAFSHYYHQVRKGRENLGFTEAIDAEEERLKGELERMINDETYYSRNYWAYSYLARGRYAEQLKVWLNFFQRENFLIINSERFFISPAEEFKETLRFLELEPVELKNYMASNAGSYHKMPDMTRKQLVEYFKPHNQRLYKLIGCDLKWD